MNNVDHGFYSKTKKELFQMVKRHFDNEYEPETEFSSWSPSLHEVLCHAQLLQLENEEKTPDYKTYVAVLDRKDLDGEVLIWWAPHLAEGNEGNFDYLAHGVIIGRGYMAVSFQDLRMAGLYDEFMDLEGDDKPADFAVSLRNEMFSDSEERGSFASPHRAGVKNLGALFGQLSMPVMTALLCLEPKKPIGDTKELRAETAKRVIGLLEIQNVDSSIATEPWTVPGAVYTRDTSGGTGQAYPDVEQWIQLLRAISEQFDHGAEKRKRDESDTADALNTEDRFCSGDRSGAADKSKPDDKSDQEDTTDRSAKRAKAEVDKKQSGSDGKDEEEIGGQETHERESFEEEAGEEMAELDKRRARLEELSSRLDEGIAKAEELLAKLEKR
jgi:hypothetical protein